MKKTAIISGITTGVLLILFIISVAATGVGDVGSGIQFFGGGFRYIDGFRYIFQSSDISGHGCAAGEIYSERFDSEITDIFIETATADTTVRVTDTTGAKVTYTSASPGMFFEAYVNNGKLCVRESAPLFVFKFGDAHSKLEIELPSKEYSQADLRTASGGIDVSGLICDKLYTEMASGHGDYSVFANELTTDLASGGIRISNCTDRKASRLNVSGASGSTEISGFSADSFKIDCASGSVRLEGVSGKGDVEAASGNISLIYGEWNADLDIDAASGQVDVTLPAGSGAHIDTNAFTGTVKYDLDGETGTLSGNSAVAVGGSDQHEITVDMASGNVYIHN